VELAQSQLQAAEARVLADRFRHQSLAARIAADNARYQPGDAKSDNDHADTIESLARVASQAERMASLTAARQAVADGQQKLATARAQPVEDATAHAANVTKLETELAAASAAVDAAWSALAVDSSEYTPLGPQYPNQSTGRRRALAQWITSDDNPLAARVAANYLWMWHFDRPLVESVANFGRNGKTPSHPELLDWLASELREGGWRMKPLHRAIVLSRSYRMGSALDAGAAENMTRDPDNRWLWRFPRQRMEAEVVRDSVLAVTGGLDLTQGGPEIDHAEGLVSRRRSLYFAQHGEGKMQLLELFDGANVCDSYRRSTSVMPQQALALANSELTLRQSRLAATGLIESVSQQTAEAERDIQLVDRAFAQILSRAPTDAERALSLDFLRQQRELFDAAMPPAESADVSEAAPGAAPSADPETRAVENLLHALLNHHDFVTIH